MKFLKFAAAGMLALTGVACSKVSDTSAIELNILQDSVYWSDGWIHMTVMTGYLAMMDIRIGCAPDATVIQVKDVAYNPTVTYGRAGLPRNRDDLDHPGSYGYLASENSISFHMGKFPAQQRLSNMLRNNVVVLSALGEDKRDMLFLMGGSMSENDREVYSDYMKNCDQG